MWTRLMVLAGVASIALSTTSLALRVQPYSVPRTEHGYPSFQGVWATEFLTMLERPPGVASLVANREQAEALAKTMRALAPAVIDPQFQLDNVGHLAMVKGEYRTSVIVDPVDGRMPFTEAGNKLAVSIEARNEQAFDHPEQRPLSERCMENLGYAPIRPLPVVLRYQILQTRDVVVIVSEGPSGPRLIHLRGGPRPEVLRSIDGYSVGSWEGNTVVVNTTHLRAEDPARDGIGRPLLLSRNSKIRERFTRVSDRELFYQFTIEDTGLYTRPWAGEFSMNRHDGPIYEYACHEGNYSLPNALRGRQAEAANVAEPK